MDMLADTYLLLLDIFFAMDMLADTYLLSLDIAFCYGQCVGDNATSFRSGLGDILAPNPSTHTGYACHYSPNYTGSNVRLCCRSWCHVRLQIIHWDS